METSEDASPRIVSLECMRRLRNFFLSLLLGEKSLSAQYLQSSQHLSGLEASQDFADNANST